MHKIIISIACTFTAACLLAGCNKTISDEPSPAPLPPATSSQTPTPESPKPLPPSPNPPTDKIYPKVNVENYMMTYDYAGAWGHYKAEVKVVKGKVVEAFTIDKVKGKLPTDISSIRTVNELLEWADKNPDAKVVWPEGSVYPTSISFDNLLAVDDELNYTITSFTPQ